MPTPDEMQRAIAMSGGTSYDPAADVMSGGPDDWKTGAQQQPMGGLTPEEMQRAAAMASGQPMPEPVTEAPWGADPIAMQSQDPAMSAPQEVQPAPDAYPMQPAMRGPSMAVSRAPRPPSLLQQTNAEMADASQQYGQAQGELDANTEERAGWAEQQGHNAADQAERTGALAAQRQAELERLGQEHQRNAAARQAVIDQHASDVTAMNADAAKFQVRDRRSVMNRVMGAVALGLAGMQDQNNLVAGLMQGMNVQTHNADSVSALISESINRDLELQRQELSNKRASVAGKQNELMIARSRMSDVNEQDAYARALIADKYASALDSLKAEGVANNAVVAGQAAAAEIRAGSLQSKAQVAQAQLDKMDQRQFALSAQEEQRRRAAAAGAKPLTPKERLELEGKVLDNEKKRRELGSTGAAGELPGYESTQALGAGDQTVARKIHSSAESLKADYQRLAQLRQKNRGGTWNRNDVTEAEALINGMGPKYSQLYGSGAPSQTEFENFTKTLVNPTDYQMTGRDPIESYKRGVNQIDAITAAQLQSYGYRKQADETAGMVRQGSARAGSR